MTSETLEVIEFHEGKNPKISSIDGNIEIKLLIFVIIVLATSVTLFLIVSKDGKNPSMSLKEGNLEIND